MSMTAFDLEQDILKCWNVTDDLREIIEDLESGHMAAPEATEALRAYSKVYERRFERCFARFEQFNREVWELRRSNAPETPDPPKPRAKKGKMS